MKIRNEYRITKSGHFLNDFKLLTILSKNRSNVFVIIPFGHFKLSVLIAFFLHLIPIFPCSVDWTGFRQCIVLNHWTWKKKSLQFLTRNIQVNEKLSRHVKMIFEEEPNTLKRLRTNMHIELSETKCSLMQSSKNLDLQYFVMLSNKNINLNFCL